MIINFIHEIKNDTTHIIYAQETESKNILLDIQGVGTSIEKAFYDFKDKFFYYKIDNEDITNIDIINVIDNFIINSELDLLLDNEIKDLTKIGENK